MASSRVCVLVLIAVLALMAQPSPLARVQGKYVCPPCGCGNDDHVFDKPGVCPLCNMRLVERGQAAQRPEQAEPRPRVAILVFNGVQIIDYAAPFEVMGQAGYDVFTVGETTAAVTTAMGMQTIPRYGFTDHPRPDILLLPGGNVDNHLQNAALISWVRSNAAAARYVLSVCNGAFFLSRAGLLEGLKATTFYGLIDVLRAQTPNATIVSDRRFVDNGKIVTTAGLSSGIDGSLHVIAKVSGPARAQMVALNMEYDWKPDGNYARASFADRHIRAIFGRSLDLGLPSEYRSSVAATAGDRTAWKTRWTVETARSMQDLTAAIERALQEQGNWSKQRGGSSSESTWSFAESGRAWRGRLAVSGGETRNAYVAELGVEETGAAIAR
jgi:putative intracellular protease/amidase